LIRVEFCQLHPSRLLDSIFFFLADLNAALTPGLTNQRNRRIHPGLDAFSSLVTRKSATSHEMMKHRSFPLTCLNNGDENRYQGGKRGGNRE
jgi:hypothetical protein